MKHAALDYEQLIAQNELWDSYSAHSDCSVLRGKAGEGERERERRERERERERDRQTDREREREKGNPKHLLMTISWFLQLN